MLPLKRLFKTRDGQIFENSIKAFKFFVASETPKKLAKFPENIYQIKQDIAQKKYQKLVLAHREVIKNHKFETELFWEAALIDSKNQYVFIYQIDSESVFFGVSPERLFKRIKIKNKNYIYTEALAGTKLSGEFENKEKQEQSFVEKFIEESLEKLCVGFEKLNSKKIIYSGNLKHLKSEYKGELREGVLDSDILKLGYNSSVLE